MIRRRLPGAVEVVTLHRSEAEEAEDVGALEAGGGGPGTAHATPARVGDVAPDEEVDAGRDESLARLLRQRRVREVLRPRPPAQRDQDLQVRVLLLERLELLEVAED